MIMKENERVSLLNILIFEVSVYILAILVA